MKRRVIIGQKKWKDVEMPVMKSFSQSGWICEESSVLESLPSRFWKAFDGIIIHDQSNAIDMAHTNNGDNSPYWILTCPYPVNLYKIQWYYRSINDQYVTSVIYVDGYNGDSWTELAEVPLIQGSLSYTFNIDNENLYSKYRIRGRTAYLIAPELKFYLRK
ncbi:MAG: hypothetical protein LUH63_07215 [Parabacteroides sp.]|nr:hypothetical protein [Parabacteroides sp.]